MIYVNRPLIEEIGEKITLAYTFFKDEKYLTAKNCRRMGNFRQVRNDDANRYGT